MAGGKAGAGRRRWACGVVRTETWRQKRRVSRTLKSQSRRGSHQIRCSTLPVRRKRVFYWQRASFPAPRPGSGQVGFRAHFPLVSPGACVGCCLTLHREWGRKASPQIPARPGGLPTLISYTLRPETLPWYPVPERKTKNKTGSKIAELPSFVAFEFHLERNPSYCLESVPWKRNLVFDWCGPGSQTDSSRLRLSGPRSDPPCPRQAAPVAGGPEFILGAGIGEVGAPEGVHCRRLSGKVEASPRPGKGMDRWLS